MRIATRGPQYDPSDLRGRRGEMARRRLEVQQAAGSRQQAEDKEFLVGAAFSRDLTISTILTTSTVSTIYHLLLTTNHELSGRRT